MATWAELRELPTTIAIDSTGRCVHESVFRSYGTLLKVRAILMSDEPCGQQLLLELIDDVLNSPQVNQQI